MGNIDTIETDIIDSKENWIPLRSTFWENIWTSELELLFSHMHEKTESLLQQQETTNSSEKKLWF